MPSSPTVAVVLVNWNGWRDTLECLESVFRSDYDNYYVIVCDNASSDGSLSKIQEWAECVRGKSANPGRPGASACPLARPSAVIRAPGIGRRFVERPSVRGLVLVQNASNLGFAGANNVGIRFALENAADYVWLLNNDTVVEPNACRELVAHMDGDRGIGMCGATLLDYPDRSAIQARGGCRYNRWFARVAPVLGDSEVGAPAGNRMDYVAGASMFVRRSFIEAVGLMEEDYFLYFEELNWSMRGRPSFRLGYCPLARVYHKESKSIGTIVAGRRSLTTEYYASRNRVRITRQFWPWCIPTVLLSLCLSALHRLFHGRWKQAAYIVAAVLGVAPHRLKGLRHLACGEAPTASARPGLVN